MRVTDKRSNIIDRSSHSRSRHSIQSKSPPMLSHSKHSNNTHHTYSKNTSITFQKSQIHNTNPFRQSATETPEFNNDPYKFIYNCEQVYALLQSVKIERNYQSSMQLISIIKQTINKLSKKKVVEGQVQALLTVLSNIQIKLGLKKWGNEQNQNKTFIKTNKQKESDIQISLHIQKWKYQQRDIQNLTTNSKHKKKRELIKQRQRQPQMIHQHQIQFSLVSNWKQMTGKQVIYTNFSLLDEQDSIIFNQRQEVNLCKQLQREIELQKQLQLQLQKQKQNKSTNTNSRANKYSMSSNQSNILVTDLNLQIQLLDSMLQGKLKNKKPRSLHPSLNNQTIKKVKPKKMLY